MSDSPLSPREIRAAAAAHDELGPEYSDAVLASFLERVDREIDARVDARLARGRQPELPAERDDRRTLLKGIVVGIGVSGIAFSRSAVMSANICTAVSWCSLFSRRYARPPRAGPGGGRAAAENLQGAGPAA
jgi:hypothetical protein